MSLFAGLEEKVNVLMDLISQLKEENKNLIKDNENLKEKNILLLKESENLSDSIKKLESSVLEETTVSSELSKEKSTMRVAVDDLINTISSFVECNHLQ